MNYFCTMRFGTALLLFSLVSLQGLSQIRVEKLIIKSNEAFEMIDTDIIVVDTLIMQDSAKVILNSHKADNFIHAKVARIGKFCKIYGSGRDGENGEPGLPGYTAVGPCKNGIPGRSGTPGSDATHGVNLYLYFNQLTIEDRLSVELVGGDGGDGGRGGAGGGGSPGTRLCQGGNGGAGGNGARGGDGGNGGNLTVSCKQCPDLRSWLGNKLIVRSFGGNAGLGGEGGYGGLAGLVNGGKNTKDGEQGAKGRTGESGQAGKNGAINFEQN